MLTVSALRLFPVKSMRGVEVGSLELGPAGPRFDREWMVIDAQGRFVTQRTAPALATLTAVVVKGTLQLSDGAAALRVNDGVHRREVTVWKDVVQANDCGDEVARWLSQRLGVDVRLVRFPTDSQRLVAPKYAAAQTRFADGFPLLVVNEASLGALNQRLARPIGLDRFRSNVVVSGAEPWAEDRWGELDVGAVRLRLVKPCARCVIITTDQATGATPDGSAPLVALAAMRTVPGLGAIFGQNAVHEGEGVVRVGDAVTVVSTQEPPAFAS